MCRNLLEIYTNDFVFIKIMHYHKCATHGFIKKKYNYSYEVLYHKCMNNSYMVSLFVFDYLMIRTALIEAYRSFIRVQSPSKLKFLIATVIPHLLGSFKKNKLGSLLLVSTVGEIGKNLHWLSERLASIDIIWTRIERFQGGI